MPIYEYQCKKCGERVELMQRFSDPPLEKCQCGGEMRKLLSPPALVFKGTGWYITDYARKGQKGGDNGNGGGAKTETPKSEPAAKSES